MRYFRCHHVTNNFRTYLEHPSWFFSRLLCSDELWLCYTFALASVNLQEDKPSAPALMILFVEFYLNGPKPSHSISSIHQFDHLAGICLQQYVPNKSYVSEQSIRYSVTRVALRTDNHRSTHVYGAYLVHLRSNCSRTTRKSCQRHVSVSERAIASRNRWVATEKNRFLASTTKVKARKKKAQLELDVFHVKTSAKLASKQ